MKIWLYLWCNISVNDSNWSRDFIAFGLKMALDVLNWNHDTAGE